MVYPRIQNSGLAPPEIAAASAAFDEICRILLLSPTEDALRDIVADSVLSCVKNGITDPQQILPCVERELTHTK
jgi:hypothetical protein